MPQDAIGRMGAGFIRPVEEPLMVDQEELCSTHVEPSSSQHQQAPIKEDNDPCQRQVVDPQPTDQEDASSQEVFESPFARMSSGAKAITQARSIQTTISTAEYLASCGTDQDQGQSSPHIEENVPNDDQGQVNGQDEDENDEVIPPRNNKEIETRRQARMDRILELRDHTLENVVGDLRRGISTRAQLKNFGEHQAHISMVEPKKVW